MTGNKRKKINSKSFEQPSLHDLEGLFDKKLKPIDTKLGKLTGGVSKLAGDVSQLTTGYGKLTADVSKLTSDVSSIKSTMVTVDDLEKARGEIKNYIHEGVGTIMDGIDKVAGVLAEKERVDKLETLVRKIAGKVGVSVDWI